MSKLRYAPKARADLAALAAHIAEDSPSRARALSVRVQDRCELLKAWPRRGRVREEIGPDVRSFPVPPLVVFYRVIEETDEVEVARVIDGRRDLGTVFFE